MFRTNEHAKVDIPVSLFGQDPSIVHYQFFERVLNNPVWVAKVLAKPDEDSAQRWQTFFIGGPVDDALRLLGLEHWAHRNLYVILPEHMTGRDRMTMQLCTAVWLCDESAFDQACWIYETDAGAVVESFLGSTMDEIKKKELLWSSMGVDAP